MFSTPSRIILLLLFFLQCPYKQKQYTISQPYLGQRKDIGYSHIYAGSYSDITNKQLNGLDINQLYGKSTNMYKLIHD